MSLRWREDLTALVMPSDVSIVHGGTTHRQACAADTAAAALAAVLADCGMQASRRSWQPRPRVRLRVSHRLAALTLVPHAHALQNDEERQAAARHGFAAVHGPKTEHWQFVVDPWGKGDCVLAAGIDALLIEGLRRAVTDAGCTLGSIEPLFCAAAASVTEVATSAHWLAVAEPEQVVLARHEAGMWKSLRTHRPRRSLADDLGTWIDQARLIDGIEGPDRIDVIATEGHDLRGLSRPGRTWALRAIAEVV